MVVSIITAPGITGADEPPGMTALISITRNDAGDLVIHPLRVQRGTALMQAFKALGEVDDDFVAALEAEQEAPLPVQDREAL